jgi:hypothetical protein
VDACTQDQCKAAGCTGSIEPKFAKHGVCFYHIVLIAGVLLSLHSPLSCPVLIPRLTIALLAKRFLLYNDEVTVFHKPHSVAPREYRDPSLMEDASTILDLLKDLGSQSLGLDTVPRLRSRLRNRISHINRKNTLLWLEAGKVHSSISHLSASAHHAPVAHALPSRPASHCR